MCEIDITEFIANEEPFEYSASVAERGQQAGPETWRNACVLGADKPLLTTPEHFDALRQWARDSGGWNATKRAAWSNAECNALFIQIISGDLRELKSLCSNDDGTIDWDSARALSEAGTIGGSMYPGDDGRIYYYLGS
jgi:hypothetical protein